MKTMIVVVLFGVIAMVASQRGVEVVDQNPEIEARAGGFTQIIRDRVTSLSSKVHDRTNSVLTLLGVNVVDRNRPPSPTPVQVVDNSQGVQVVDNNPYPTPVHVVDNSHNGGHNFDNSPYPTPVQVVDNSHNGVHVVDNSPLPYPGHNFDDSPYPTPVQVVDNSHNGVNVVDNNPYHGHHHDGIIDNVDPGFSQGGNYQGVDPGFNRPPYRPNRPGGNPGVIDVVDPGFNQPGINNQGVIDVVDPGFNQPGINNQGGPDSDVYYRRQQSPWLRGGK